ncbi:DNA-directed RNA polymerase subunit beta' [Mesomycoplasma conjunctivae]|uniref:DNA-directed RNA polymerase subunit beta' n=1 Tax=Mesomycoplasma conjunctivae (strain ATCC 25834 / NCTC 10147 / HRC/581) TaxID=572263 RepID=C5J7B4_MESCH|nr:DNA-directed RNA polymerase subunit beta' [Mesomycoplasma conjunctivae]CAT05377.1 DNA-directed RNA polymerase subunit beta [Mesomycoplasma conjunctivae]VEU66603.1 DNA-directed RNA polymerase subunit beta' [Mesomycoplasma conjunctivae]
MENKNKVSRQYAKLYENTIEKISLALATPQDVLEWSRGEVTKAETINYKTFKPERGGLFDELIFGPLVDYKCSICGKKYKKSNENQICAATRECIESKSQILPKLARRYSMGHIALNAPILHFWFFKIDHSIIAKLLGLKVQETEKSKNAVSKSSLEQIIYYKSHIVLETGGLKSLQKHKIIDIGEAGLIYKNALVEILEKYEPDTEEYEAVSEALSELTELASSKIGREYGIDYYELNEIIEEYSGAKISTGTEAIEALLDKLDLHEERARVEAEILEIQNQLGQNKKTIIKNQKRDKLYKRLQVINAFINSKQDPKSMIIRNLPVIPADLRPLVQLDGSRHSTSDVNELYRRIIIRNNRLKKWYESNAPVLIIQNELRMLQEAIDALIDNQKKTNNQVTTKDNRPLKSISDSLTGKKGRFRQNLLGKRVDYSGRSVIVVGPKLKMYQAGLPRRMAATLFEPWIIRTLIQEGKSSSIKHARKMIEEQNPVIWPYVAKVIENKSIILNRAPTLHRLSIQAFEPILVRGKAIQLHPLVTAGFNADFDGDQMAVHVPISPEAVRETKELMFANRNILGPKDGEPIVNPSQDMILGLYYLTQEKEGAKGEGSFFGSYDEMMKAYEFKSVELHARVAISFDQIKPGIAKQKRGHIISTVGKFILNNIFPENFPFIFDDKVDELELNYGEQIAKYVVPYGTNIVEKIASLPLNEPFSKKIIAKIVRQIFNTYDGLISKEDVADVINKLDFENYQDCMLSYENIKDYKGVKLPITHISKLSEFTVFEFDQLFRRHKKYSNSTAKVIEDYEKVYLLERIWFKYNNMVSSILDQIKDLGFYYSTISGTSIAISDIKIAPKKHEFITQGETYINQLNEFYTQGLITDDERYVLAVQKWTEIKNEIQQDLNNSISHDNRNSVVMMMKSGARGNISNFVQLAGMRGLMANNVKTLKVDAENERVVRSIVEVPVKSSFLEGLTSFEFYSSTHGARKGLTDTALNTAKSGYLTRRLVDVAQNIVVTEEDCFSDFGFTVKDIIDTKTGTIIVPLIERIEGRFLNKDIYNSKGQRIAIAGKMIDLQTAKAIIDAGIKEVEIRSILSCHVRNSVCKKCYGKDLATNRLVSIGEAVGIIAAQSIGEPGTQLTMRTFHTGGVANVDDITGGFTRLIELIDSHEHPWGRPAKISPFYGRISQIRALNDKDTNVNKGSLITIEYINSEKEKAEHIIRVEQNQKLRVKVGDKVIPGQKLVEGPIILKELLSVSDARTLQNYLLKEIQRIYRMQGITISDKYIEIIIRQMLSKVQIIENGDSNFFIGSIIDISEYQEVNGKLISEGKKPAFGNIIVKGAKQIPLLSNSFLAAASYQETSKILVHSVISSQVDRLEGLKENIIVGHKIPAGTNSNYEHKSKFDIRDPFSFFASNKN